MCHALHAHADDVGPIASAGRGTPVATFHSVRLHEGTPGRKRPVRWHWLSTNSAPPRKLDPMAPGKGTLATARVDCPDFGTLNSHLQQSIGTGERAT